MTGEAVKVMLGPLHAVTDAGDTLTAGAAAEVMLTVTVLLVAVGLVTHSALLVITTDTTSLLLKVVEVKVFPEPATLLPFTFH